MVTLGQEKVFVSIPELARLTGWGEGRLYAWAHENKLAGCRRFGRQFRIHWPTFQEWMLRGADELWEGDEEPVASHK